MNRRTMKKLLEEAERQTLDYFKDFKSPYSDEEKEQRIKNIKNEYDVPKGKTCGKCKGGIFVNAHFKKWTRFNKKI